MKSPIPIFILLSLVFLRCGEQPKRNPEGNTDSMENNSETDTSSISENSKDNANMNGKPTKPDILTGVFIRKNDKGGCHCNCVDVNFMETTELCLDEKSSLSIMAMYRRNPDGSLSVYYVKPQNRGGVAQGKIPWEEFATTKPIATISYSSNDSFYLDWIGFTKDGELAIDYAIYGKKNLEGDFVHLEATR